MKLLKGNVRKIIAVKMALAIMLSITALFAAAGDYDRDYDAAGLYEPVVSVVDLGDSEAPVEVSTVSEVSDSYVSAYDSDDNDDLDNSVLSYDENLLNDVDEEIVSGVSGVIVKLLSVVQMSFGCCADSNVTHSGSFGNITAANSPTGAIISGATWEFCAACGTVTVDGGAIQMPDNTNTLSQNAFPAAIRPNIARVVFAEPIIAGTSLQCLFHGLTNLTEIVGLNQIDTSLTRNFRRMFMETGSIGHVDLSMWNTNRATNMYRMFHNSGVHTLNLGGTFNTGGLVDNYGSMFWGASNLTTIGDVSNWNTSGAIRMSRMFQGASNLQSLNISNWNTSNVTLMYNMFHLATGLTSLNISNWNVGNVLRMDNMFNGATGLTSLDLSGWNTHSLQRMDNMFDGANNLISLDLRNFITSNVVNRNNAFRGFLAQKIILGSGWDWNVFNTTALQNPPNNETHTGLWIRVGTGTVLNPAGPETATSAQLLDNSLSHVIADTWIWQPVTPSYVVSFDLNGGTYSGNNELLTQIIIHGSDAIELSEEPTRANYRFDGWLPVVDVTNVMQDRTFVAQWELIVNNGGNDNGGDDEETQDPPIIVNPPVVVEPPTVVYPPTVDYPPIVLYPPAVVQTPPSNDDLSSPPGDAAPAPQVSLGEEEAVAAPPAGGDTDGSSAASTVLQNQQPALPIADEVAVTVESQPVSYQQLTWIDDPNMPRMAFGGRDVLLFAPIGEGSWSLLSLILTVLGSVLAVVTAFRVVSRRKDKYEMEDDDTSEEKANGFRNVCLIAAIVMAIAGVVAFITFNDMSMPLVMVNIWTVVNAIIVAIEATAIMLMRKGRKEQESMQAAV